MGALAWCGTPVHSTFMCRPVAPRPHRSELPGAEEFWVRKHVTNCGKGTHVEDTSNKVDVVLVHVPFLGHDIVYVY